VSASSFWKKTWRASNWALVIFVMEAESNIPLSFLAGSDSRTHIHQLKPITLIMIAAGAFIGFWAPFSRRQHEGRR
jgi:hypothetical protein